MPKPGRIKIYTSGCPKNQNKCWNNTGSPPPKGSKKEVLRLRSVKSIVIPPAKTGRDNNSKIAVNKTDHPNKGIFSGLFFILSALIIVVIKLIAPKIEEAPAKCKEKIPRSTEGPSWEILEDRGGYTVQPVPTPVSTIPLIIINIKEGGNNQNLRLFIRGKAISGFFNIKGINQFPNPPIKIGMTIKKNYNKSMRSYNNIIKLIVS